MQPKVIWMTASPLWGQLAQAGNTDRLQQPALLRFNTDKFMDDLRGLLNMQDDAQRKAGFAALQAQAETFLELTGSTPPLPNPMKLYQPIHGHFYLVACALVCRMPGFPDRKLQLSRKERASFVLRRQQTIKGVVTEFGLIAPDAATAPAWQPIADPQGTTALEARIPLCPLHFQENGRSRRLLIGLIPVANKQNLDAASPAAPTLPAADLQPEKDSRVEEFEDSILTPIKDLAGASTSTDQDAQQLSLFVFLDLANYLQANISDVWTAVTTGNTTGLSAAEATLYTLLTSITAQDQNGNPVYWNTALNAVWSQRDAINSTGVATNPTLAFDLRPSNVAGLEAAVTAALPGPIKLPVPMPAPNINPNAGDSYVVRCVFDQPDCRPLTNAPPVPQSLVSQPSDAFQLSSVFDPDAPARTVTLALPVDTSIAGLRKFKKNVRFIMSDLLRNQMERINEDTVRKGTTGPSGGFSLGHICSFSFEIMFIIAFVLMFVFLLILNIVFWWIAFFKICFPIPVIKSD